MAKHMQCVQAIRNCMKKVKAEYHSIPPLRPSVVPIPRNLYSFFSYIVNIATIIILTVSNYYYEDIIKAIARTCYIRFNGLNGLGHAHW